MVNFNFGLGSKSSQQDNSTADPVTTQDDAVQSDTVVVPQGPTPTPPEVPTPEEKPVAEVLPEQNSEEISPPAEAVQINTSPTETIEEGTPDAEEVVIETTVEKETPEISPEEPVSLEETENTEEKPEEDPSTEKEPTETPKMELPVNPFATPEPTIVEKESEQSPEEAAPKTVPAPVNPFTTLPFVAKEEKQPVSEPFAPVQKTEPQPVVRETMPLFGGNEPAISDTKQEVTSDKDPMLSVSKVKNDIVAFVNFHQQNIQNFEKNKIDLKKKYQEDTTNLERKIQEEKQLLKNKGNSYAKMLKELQDLTQNFEAPRGTQPEGKQQHRATQNQRQENRK